MFNAKTKKAFTIVELVIVIAVIAILMGIMFVGGTAISNNAKASTLTSDFRSFETNIKAMINDPANADLGKDLTNANVKAMVNDYFEDDLAVGDLTELTAEGSNTTGYEGETALKDPYGIEYRVVYLDNSSDEHTDLSFCVYSCGKNKQTSTTDDAWDKDDTVLVVRVWDSVVYTETIAPGLTDGVSYQQNVNDAFKAAGLTTEAGVKGDFTA